MSDALSSVVHSGARHLMVDSIDALAKWGDAWAELERHANASGPFCSYEFCRTWWLHYADASCQLRAILVFDQQRLVGVAPFYLKRSALPLVPATLHLVGQGEAEEEEVCAEYQDILAWSGCEEGVAAIVAEQLRRLSGWARLTVKNLLSDSVMQTYLMPLLSERGCSAVLAQVGLRYRVRLPDSWQTYLQSLKKRNRHKITQARRRLAEQKDYHFQVVEQGSGLDGAMRELAVLHERRWAMLGVQGSFGNKTFSNFHRDWSRHLLDTGRLRLYLLHIGDRAAAAIYQMHDGRTAYYYQSGADIDQWGALSPGRLIISYAIERAIESGDDWFDFMRGADESYKQSYGCETAPMFALTVFRETAAGVLAHWLFLLRKRLVGMAGKN